MNTDGQIKERAALILAGGPLHTEGNQGHLLAGPFEWIVAADSGVRHALTLGVQPTVVMGDMDSIDRDLLDQFAPISIEVGADGQYKMDSELAMDWALEQGADRIVLAGGLGGRFDQSLANAQLLIKIEEHGVQGVVTDGREAVYLLSEKTHSIQVVGVPGTVLSVLPLERCVGVDICGVEWPVVNFQLVPGTTRTLSNELTDREAKLSLRSGTALVVVGDVV